MIKNKLVLSLFPGIDLLGRAFEQHGFCVVRGPDLMTGGDIRDFSVPPGRFDAVIGGPPCQDFSKLNRNPGQYSYAMLDEFKRVVSEAAPQWWLCENVATLPPVEIAGYQAQRFELDLAWYSEFTRLRHFVFSHRDRVVLNPMKKTRPKTTAGGAVTGADHRSFEACCEIQGLARDFSLPYFSRTGKQQAVGNAVPLAMGMYLAGLIASTVYQAPPEKHDHKTRRCSCGCGRVVVGRASYASAACRKRAERWRAAAAS